MVSDAVRWLMAGIMYRVCRRVVWVLPRRGGMGEVVLTLLLLRRRRQLPCSLI